MARASGQDYDIKACSAKTVDFFKPVNDTHGHDVGDKVLQELATRIRENIRNVDLACRVGGEEFIIILPATELHLAQKIAERIRKAIAAKPFSAGALSDTLKITVSIGLSTLADSNDKVDEFLRRADQAIMPCGGGILRRCRRRRRAR